MPILKKLNKAGETIVEALICMAILSFAIGIAYGLARRNLAEVEAAQEHAQSLKIAQAQIERIKQYVATNAATGYTALTGSAAPTCMLNKNVGGLTIQNAPSTTDVVCAVDGTGVFNQDFAAPPSVTNYPYRAGYMYDSTKDTFYVYAGRLSASASKVNSLGYDFVTLQYRIHP